MRSEIALPITMALLLAAGPTAQGQTTTQEAVPAMADPNGSPYDDEEVPARAYQLYDQITIVVDERTSGVNNTSLRTQEQSSYAAKLKDFIGFKDGNLVDGLDGDKGIDFQSEKQQNSRGQQSVTRSISSKFTARVVEVLPNGHLVLEARRHRRLDFEEETLILFGVVNPEHISKATDMVQSDRLADLDLQIIPNGAIADSEQRGWLSWLWDRIWPF